MARNAEGHLVPPHKMPKDPTHNSFTVHRVRQRGAPFGLIGFHVDSDAKVITIDYAVLNPKKTEMHDAEGRVVAVRRDCWNREMARRTVDARLNLALNPRRNVNNPVVDLRTRRHQRFQDPRQAIQQLPERIQSTASSWLVNFLSKEGRAEENWTFSVPLRTNRTVPDFDAV